jgi:hypothetical protein
MLAAIMAAIRIPASPEKPRFWGLVRMIRPVCTSAGQTGELPVLITAIAGLAVAKRAV